MDLQKLRLDIDEIDDDIIRLFEKRMEVTSKIALYKKKHDLPIHDPVREQQKIHELTMKVSEKNKPYISDLFALLFKISRIGQEKVDKE